MKAKDKRQKSKGKKGLRFLLEKDSFYA